MPDIVKREVKPRELNPRQKAFCELYASSEEFFGNGVKSYLEAYNEGRKVPIRYESAMMAASNLLRNSKVMAYVNSLLEMRGLNDGYVDKQLEFLISQHADFRSKLGAIAEYNKLKKRIEDKSTQNKLVIVNIAPETANKYGIKPTTQSSGSDSQ